MALVLFPRDSMTPMRVDAAFDREWRAAKAVGFEVVLIEESCLDLDAVQKGNGETAIYRGWMLSTVAYATLYHELWKLGYHLINEPDEYRYCHELPSWYPDFVGSTPESVWFPTPRDGEALDMAGIVSEVREKLGPGPYIVKDYVKSRKHEWAEACFIEGPDDIERITTNFIERQGSDLAGGLVFRKFQAFRRIGEHTKSGMPLVNEVRTWTLCGGPLVSHRYWGPDEGGGNIAMPRGLVDIADLEGKGTAKRPLMSWRVKSNFFTMDLAQLPETLGGGWIIVELGDGQVAGLPEHVDAKVFYEALRRRFM